MGTVGDLSFSYSQTDNGFLTYAESSTEFTSHVSGSGFFAFECTVDILRGNSYSEPGDKSGTVSNFKFSM